MALLMDDTSAASVEVVAGRYRIESRIAKGGMGAVYRAFDRVEGRTVALKRLRTDADARRRTRMFEREFHTLAGLAHPRIIAVYDYGVDERGAYYTMELLDGRDLRELAPLPYPVACRYLRDVASSLALLHARYLLHRDLSPRNVRITSDGRAKLLDFGALSGFGKNTTVVGTAPCVPPEALLGMALDHRADLYSLGSLAYFLLTGRHAFDVQAIADLPEAWNHPPPPPSELARAVADLPDIPNELDDLVLSLLSRNPLARPASAAEVIGRVSTLAGLPAEHEPLFALSYLQGGPLVGRARERAQLRRRMKSALAGRGATVLITAEPGLGSARLLHELALEARLLGATATLADADAQRGPYAVAEQLIHQLLAAQPEKAGAALQDDPELARFLPGHKTASGTRRSIDRVGADPREARLRTQRALLAFFERLSHDTPLLIAVHGLHRTDDHSGSLLAALAKSAESRRILLALAESPDEPAAAPEALANLRALATPMPLRGLTIEEVRAMVTATFGDIPHTERLVTWLHALTSGKPQACRDLLQHLIEQDVIRFHDGVWSLPHELSENDLPDHLEQALDARIERLQPDAKRLALALCVHGGPIPIERCLALAELERVPSPFRALTELEQRGVLIADDDSVRFAHAAVRESVHRLLAEPDRQRLHAQLGALLTREASDDPEVRIAAGFHLLQAGAETRGAELLAETGRLLAFDPSGVPAAIPALEAALEVFVKQRRGARELARVLGPLVLCGFHKERRVLVRYGDGAAETMQRALGLGVAGRLRRFLGAPVSTLIGLGTAFVSFLFAYGPRRALPEFREAVSLYITAVSVLTGHGTLTLDAERARSYARLLEPLRYLGRNSASNIAYRFTRALARLPEDRTAQTLTELRALLARLDDADRPIYGLQPEARELMRSSLRYACGSLETFREDPEALRIADELDAMGSQLNAMFANQIRATWHGLRGEEEQADEYRRRVELFAVQAGTGWQAELWGPSSAILCYMLTHDSVGLRRVHAQIERLCEDVPSLRKYAGLSLAGCRTLQGDYAGAYAIGRAVVKQYEPRSFLGWGSTQASQLRDLALCGNPEDALRVGLYALAQFDAAERQVTTHVTPIVVNLAMVEAQLGDTAGAAARIEGYLEEIGKRGGPATRGSLHEARARIALWAGDFATARAQASLVERWFRPTANPALITRCERLRREIETESAAVQRPPATSDMRELGLTAAQLVRRALASSESATARFARALELLVAQAGATRGVLLRYDTGGLQQLAPRPGEPIAEGDRSRLLEEIERADHADDAATVAISAASIPVSSTAESSALRAAYLVVSAGDKVVGAAILWLPPEGSVAPLGPLLDAIAEALRDETAREALG